MGMEVGKEVDFNLETIGFVKYLMVMELHRYHSHL